MELTNLTEYYIPIIVILCLIVGYILKKWVKDVDNKYIPTIVTILGAVVACGMNGLSVAMVVSGALSGLASTGLHQAFKNLIEK